MKFFISIILCCFLYTNQADLYNISFHNLTETTTDMMALSGKRILVMVVNPVNPDMNQIRLTDSVAHTDSIATKLIVVPALDLTTDTTQIPIDTLSAHLPGLVEGGIIVSAPAFTKKASGASQHPLLKWLTSVNENGHFNDDVEQDCQLFMINPEGILYAVHPRKLNASSMRNVMLQNITD